ncbi:DnaD domain protein [Ignavigranum ruoffiae]|uniref:DnaD domain protein n=1 Tax=Ignavigranum ruoffiae TaxID=89093 RepID=UPI003AFF92A0
MSVKRVVDTEFWSDSYVVDHYSVEDKYFYIYLMTNPKSTQVGIYALPRRIISFETGYTLEVIDVLLDRFQTKYQEIIYNFQTQEITLLNSLKHSVIKGGKPVIDLICRELSQIKDSTLIAKTYHHLVNWWNQSRRSFDLSLKSAFEEEMSRRHSIPQSHNEKENQKQNQIQNNNHGQNQSQKQNHNQESVYDSSDDSAHQFDFAILNFYAANIGTLNDDIKHELQTWSKEFDAKIIFEALSRSMNAKHPMAYGRSILATWKNQGVNTLEDIMLLDEKYKENKRI